MNCKLLKLSEAATELNMAKKTLTNWVGQGRVGYVRLGRSIRIPQSELERLISEGSTPARNN